MIGLILPVWKEIGESTHFLTQNISDQIGEICAHTGTLDPMASGVVVVLGGLTRFDKSRYSDGLKKYEVEVVFGVSTDTEDLLGLITEIRAVPLSLAEIQQSKTFELGTKPQIPHFFSAVREKDLPRKVTIHNFDVMSGDPINRDELLAKCISKIRTVQGDFRQEEIIRVWCDSHVSLPSELQTLKINLTTSRGFYVRSLVRDLSDELNIPMVISSLSRVENAGFSKKDCVRDKLEQHVGLTLTSWKSFGNHN